MSKIKKIKKCGAGYRPADDHFICIIASVHLSVNKLRAGCMIEVEV